MSFVFDAVKEKVEALIAENKAKFSDEAAAAAQSLRDAGKIGFGDAEPARTCLERFLSASGEDWEFELGKLFGEDKDVRKRVLTETIRRTIQAPTDREKGVINGYGVLAMPELQKRLDKAIDPLITIFQRNYSHVGWWGALGNFGLKIEILEKWKGASSIVVKLSGEGVYKWAPEQDGRPTQALHKLGQRLIELGKAKEFKQIAKPRTFIVNVFDFTVTDDTGQRLEKLEEYKTQFNPENGMQRVLEQAVRYISR